MKMCIISIIFSQNFSHKARQVGQYQFCTSAVAGCGLHALKPVFQEETMLGNYCFQCIAKRICRVLILVVLVLALKQSANATTYYISLQGSDSNSGTQGSPWVSLQHAIQVAGGGDTVLMRGGIYQTDEVWIRGDFGMGGSNGQYLPIRNYPGEVVSVGGAGRH